MSSSHREVEVPTASQCNFISGQVLIPSSSDSEWQVTCKTSSPSEGYEAQPCNFSELGTTMKIQPMTRQFGGWNDSHFHPNLRLPVESSVQNGLVVMLEALASECVAVALSPDSSFVLGKTYVVHFGAGGNLSTVFRRRLVTRDQAVDAQFAGRVCSPERYIPYWICLLKTGQLWAGVGREPGKRCVGTLNDELYHKLRSPKDAVKYIGVSNSALGRHAKLLKLRNVVVTTVPESLVTALQGTETADLAMINVDTDGPDPTDTVETKQLMEEYQKECQKARARAKKFGLEYKEPSPQAFFQWSQAKKLRFNPQKGFITGMDITAPEEEEKKKARAARFGLNVEKRGRDEHSGEQEEENPEVNGVGGNAMDEDDVLPVVQAWENEPLTKPQRKDPPRALWVNPPLVEEQEDMVEDEGAVFSPSKIHIFSIDWAAFKQIRTDDIMKYFESYGPSYVEWLGELSCNILFEDKFSAARALQNLSQQLPSPPPEELTSHQTDDVLIPDLAGMGWSFCQKPIRKITNDRYGRRGTTARVLMRVATSSDVLVEKPTQWPKPPPGFTTKRVLGPGSDFRKQKRRRKSYMEDGEEVVPAQLGGGEEHPALSRGLRSERGGYSVEELQAERAAAAAVQNEAVGTNADGIPPSEVTATS